MPFHEYVSVIYMFWAAICFLAIFMVLIDLLKNQNDEPQRTTLWMILVLSFPVFGMILYLLTGRNRRNTLGRRVAASADRYLAEVESHPKLKQYYGDLLFFEKEDLTETGKMLRRMLPETLFVSGNQLLLLRDGNAAYPEMLNAIREARHTISLQSFIIANDQFGHLLMEALRERAESGVEVRVLYDRFGSFFTSLSRMFLRYEKGLKNFQVRPFSLSSSLTNWRFELRNHRKLLVVDSRIAFLGGINISQENIGNGKSERFIHDLHCRVDGPSVVQLETIFLRDWYYASRESPEHLLSKMKIPALKSKGDAVISVIASGWGQSFEASESVFYTAAATATRSLWIISPYFVPDLPYVKALRLAASRGIDVRIIVPRLNNHFYVKWATRSLYESLLTDNVRIFERKNMFVHAKALLVDSSWGMVGSSNCDVRSFRLNFELDMMIRDKTFLSELELQLLHEMEESDEITLDAVLRKPLRVRIGENLCALLSPVL